MHKKAKGGLYKYKIYKRGFELSINFIVIFILSLAMLGVGFYFSEQIFSQTLELGKQLDAQTKSQIESKLRDPSALVAIGLNQKEIKRGEHDSFGVGVANRNKEKGYFYLTITCKFGTGKDKDNAEITYEPLCTEDQTCCSKWVMTPKLSENEFRVEVGELEPNKFEAAPVFFNINKKAASGKYVYNVQVYRADSKATMAGTKYDSVKKIYVNVP